MNGINVIGDVFHPNSAQGAGNDMFLDKAQFPAFRHHPKAVAFQIMIGQVIQVMWAGFPGFESRFSGLPFTVIPSRNNPQYQGGVAVLHYAKGNCTQTDADFRC